MASQSRVRIDDRLNEGAEGLAVPKGPGELMHPDDLAVRREEFHLHAHGPGSDGRASDKGFASRRGAPPPGLRPPPSAGPPAPSQPHGAGLRPTPAGRPRSRRTPVPRRPDP